MRLASEPTNPLNFDRAVFDRAVREVFNQGGFSPEMLSDPAVRALIEETYNTLNGAINSAIRTETPPELTAALQNNAFIFSGFKSYHSLSEVGLALTDADGHVKSYDTFRKDVEAIDRKYNQNYLYAEYNHAVHTSQMAVKWQQFADSPLPPSDPFWNSYLPPNGWNCRCDVDQVLRSDYKMSDPERAMSLGDACTDTPKSQMFRYNAGKEMTVFPQKHPYLPKDCGDCNQRGRLNLATRIDRALPQCRVCGEVFRECRREGERRLKEWKEANIPERGGLTILGENFRTGSLMITRGSIKSVLGHTLNLAVRNSLLGILKGALKYEYIGWKECSIDKQTGIRKHSEAAFFLYYKVEIAGQTYYANVKAHRHYKAEELYCIRDRCNISDLRHDAPPTIENW